MSTAEHPGRKRKHSQISEHKLPHPSSQPDPQSAASRGSPLAPVIAAQLLESHGQPYIQHWINTSAQAAQSPPPESPDPQVPLSGPLPTSTEPVAVISEPGLTSTSVPLTRKNLKIHTMVSQSGKASNAPSSSQPKTIARIRDVLAVNHILPHHPNDTIPFKETLEKAKLIATGGRHTDNISESSAEKTRDAFQASAFKGEATFLTTFFQQCVIKTSRPVPGKSIEQIEDRSWIKDKVLGVADKLFHANAMKDLQDIGDYDKKAIKLDQFVMSVPKPDLAYGFLDEAFDDDETDNMQHYIDLFRVHPDVISVFLLVEGKSYSGTIEDAETQASRGAAALLCAQRQLNMITGLVDDKNGVDRKAMVFSLALTTSMARLSVHFIEIRKETLYYHSHHVNSYFCEYDEHVNMLKRDMRNIKEWGIEVHKDHVKQVVKKLGDESLQEQWPKNDNKSTSSKKGKRSIGQ